MQRLTVFLLIMAVAVSFQVVAQDKAESGEKSEGKRCTPRVAIQPHKTLQEIHLSPGEKTVRQTPIVAFEVLESGNVIHARLERSSGITEIDNYALGWVRSTKFNRRPGCAVFGAKMSVDIDFAP